MSEWKCLDEDMKYRLLNLANSLDFDICDFKVVDGIELVGKRMSDCETIVYWPIENEGSGFCKLFKGFSTHSWLYRNE